RAGPWDLGVTPSGETIMIEHFDALETREPGEREADLFSRLPGTLRKALTAPLYAERLRGLDLSEVASRAALARLPLLRKSDLPALQQAAAAYADPWRGARALFAAGFRPGDVVLNTFSYHLTPGGFIFDTSARALD